jgi:UDP-N-acetylmuramoyl-tripeptide--D-alanyl-D-alanine ligase
MFREFMLGKIAGMVNGRVGASQQELVRGVSIDSRNTRHGDIFFALRGRHTDGHLYVADALRRGALAAVVERTLSAPAEILVENSLFALGELARHYRDYFEVKTIAITGTNGKTSVKNIIAAILKQQTRVLHTEKNYNSLIGLPLTVLRISGREQYLVLEMGTSAPGEIKRLCEIAQPDVGVITNIGAGHLEGLKSMEGIRKEKFALLDALPEDGIALVGEGVDAQDRDNISRFSMDMLQNVDITERGSSFSYRGNTFFTRLLGIGNVYNCLAAICLTSLLGIDDSTQRSAIAELRPEPARMEPIVAGRTLIIDDTYNANPASMKSAIDFVARLDRRKILVLGDMLELGERSEELHEEIGVYARECADMLISFGRTSRYYKGVHFTEQALLRRYLEENITGGEVVLFKASRALHFEKFISELLPLLR